MKNIIQKIINANKKYREGNPVISDEEYDVLLSKLEKQMSFIEFEDLKRTLHEDSGEVTHDFVIGSLNKVKFGENQLQKFIKVNKIKQLFASLKIDGCSFVAKYYNGKLTNVATRGDGSTGVDITNKAIHILPNDIAWKGEIQIRGELLLTGDSHVVLGFKNRRNGVVGIINRDDIDENVLKHVNYFAYQILNTYEDICSQFKTLNKMGFNVPPIAIIDTTPLKNDEAVEEALKYFYDNYKETIDYNIDGLVVSSVDCQNENEYFPKKKVAFKINSEGINAKVKSINWRVSKNGLLKPVLRIEPTEIDGTTVSNVTAYNAKYLKENNVGIDSIVSIIKSGEIIPKIINVVKNSKFVEPTTCPVCGNTNIVWSGVDIKCSNQNCEAATTKQVMHFLGKCGIERVSVQSLLNWNINTFDDLFSWKPVDHLKSQKDFYQQIIDKIFSKDEVSLFTSFSFDGAGETNVTKILNHYCVKNVVDISFTTEFLYNMSRKTTYDDYPEGIGQTTINKLKDSWIKNIQILNKIKSDSRWKPIESKKEETKMESSKLKGKSFLLTGTLSQKRSIIEKEIIENGGTIASSVNKDLNVLICGEDSWGTSSKYKKAEKLGITILFEAEYRNLLKD